MRLHLEDWGGAGPPVLLLHGMMGNTHWWNSAAPLLKGLRPIALDFRGHGDSEWTADGAYGLEGFLEDIDAAKRGLGLSEFYLVGHSFGARVALAYAAHAPTGLKAVAGLDFLCEFSRRSIGHLARARHRPQPAYGSREEILRRFRLEPGGTVLPSGELERLGERCVRQTPEGRWTWKFDWRLLGHAYTPVWPLLPEIRIPILAVRGELSPLMPREHLEEIARRAGARVREIPGAYHHIPLDAPGETATLLLEFFGAIGAA